MRPLPSIWLLEWMVKLWYHPSDSAPMPPSVWTSCRRHFHISWGIGSVSRPCRRQFVEDTLNVLVGQNDVLVDRNEVLVDQNVVLADQDVALVDQNVALVDQKRSGGGKSGESS